MFNRTEVESWLWDLLNVLYLRVIAHRKFKLTVWKSEFRSVSQGLFLLPWSLPPPATVTQIRSRWVTWAFPSLVHCGFSTLVSCWSPQRPRPLLFLSLDPASCSADCLLTAVQLNHRAVLYSVAGALSLQCQPDPSVFPSQLPEAIWLLGVPAHGPHVALVASSGHFLAVCGGLQPLLFFWTGWCLSCLQPFLHTLPLLWTAVPCSVFLEINYTPANKIEAAKNKTQIIRYGLYLSSVAESFPEGYLHSILEPIQWNFIFIM